MCAKFGSTYETATSQDVESEFKTLKHHVATKTLMRADKFILLHTDYLFKSIKLAFAEQATNRIEKRPRKKTRRSTSLDCSDSFKQKSK